MEKEIRSDSASRDSGSARTVDKKRPVPKSLEDATRKFLLQLPMKQQPRNPFHPRTKEEEEERLSKLNINDIAMWKEIHGRVDLEIKEVD